MELERSRYMHRGKIRLVKLCMKEKEVPREGPIYFYSEKLIGNNGGQMDSPLFGQRLHTAHWNNVDT